MEEFDLSPDELVAKELREIQSSRRDFRPYGKRDLIRRIRVVYSKSRLIGNIETRYPQLYRQGLWIFGSWDDALQAAGLGREVRRRKSWNRDKLANKIRALRRQELPLSANWAMKNHHDVFDAALREHGSWSKALIAAGVIKSLVPRKTRLGLLRELRDLLERSNAVIPEPLKLYLAYYFGSVGNALAFSKTDQRLLGGWSKPKIIATLARMHRSKEKLAYAEVKRESQALISAAEAYFGSWGRALHAAGIDPNQYFVRRKWRLGA
jgi:hypothetical protein